MDTPRPRPIVPIVVAGAVGLLLLTQLRALVGNAGETAEGLIDHAGDAAGGIVQQAGQVVVKPTGPPGGQRLATPAEIIDLVARGVRNSIEVGDVLGDEIVGLTIAEEVELGRQFHQKTLSDPNAPPSTDAAMVAWLEELTAPFLPQALQTASMTYTVTLLETDMVNAFSHVGGYIYVCRGLLEAMQYDPAAVKFVIGHEIAHVELRHCARRVYAQYRIDEAMGPAIGSLGGLLHQNLQVSYSQEDELDCDLWSYKAMRRMNHSIPDCLRATEMMVAMEQAAGHGAHHHDPQNAAEAVARAVHEHFCTHPRASERLAQLNAAE